MTGAKDTDAQRLERKIDGLAADWGQRFEQLHAKFEQIHQQFEKIGRLEERIAAYMGIAERIEQANQQDVRDLNTKYADHEARLRGLEATVTAHATATGLRNRMTDGTVTKVVIPVLLVLGGFFVSEWARGRNAAQVTVTAPTVIDPSPRSRP